MIGYRPRRVPKGKNKRLGKPWGLLEDQRQLN